MFKEGWKVFWACVIGAGIGTMAALEFGPYFWWIGLLVGGLTGYLSYEWRKVLAVLPVAWRAARGVKVKREACLRIIYGFIGGLGFFLTFFLFLFLVKASEGGYNEGWYKVGILDAFGIMVTCLSVFSLVFILSIEDLYLEPIRKVAIFTLPPVWMFYLLFFAVIIFPHFLWVMRREIATECWRAVCAVGRFIASFFSFLKRFFWELFLRIHSEIRLLCGVDSFLGAGVGYFAGSVMVGALAGAAFGLVNYLVVTKGWLEIKGYLPLVSK